MQNKYADVTKKLVFLNPHGVPMLTPHLAVWEYRCRHCGGLPEVKEEAHMRTILMLFDIFEAIRHRFGRPIKVTSGYRCHTHQLELLQQGKKAAKYSPHEYGIALDMTAGTAEANERLYKLINGMFGWVRLGFFKYGQQFIHMDVAPALPKKLMPKGSVIINGKKYKVSDLWSETGARW